MSQPKISVIVPVHNPGKYFKPLLNSIIRQTFTDIEIFLIDDGSTDGSRDIIKEYAEKDSRIQYIFRDKNPEENFGQKYSADLGRQKAQGEYIMLIDHDDELMLDALEVLYSYTDNGTVDVIQGRNISIDENNNFTYYTANYWPTPRYIHSLDELTNEEIWHHLINAPPALWTCLIKKDFQKNIELTDICFNDFNFVWKMKILSKNFCYIPRYIYINNTHLDSTTYKYNRIEILKNLYDLEKFLKEQSVNFGIWNIFSIFEFYVLKCYLNEPCKPSEKGGPDLFIKETIKTLQRNPDISDYLFIEEDKKQYQELRNIRWDK